MDDQQIKEMAEYLKENFGASRLNQAEEEEIRSIVAEALEANRTPDRVRFSILFVTPPQDEGGLMQVGLAPLTPLPRRYVFNDVQTRTEAWIRDKYGKEVMLFLNKLPDPF